MDPGGVCSVQPSLVSPVTFCLCGTARLGKVLLLPVESAVKSVIFGAVAVFSPTYARVRAPHPVWGRGRGGEGSSSGDFNMISYQGN